MVNNNQIIIKSDLSEVKVLSEHFRTFCELNHLNEQISSLLELAIVEATNNIIIHAYNRIPDFEIQAEYQLIDSELSITLIDYGKKFTKKKNDNKQLNTDIQNLPEGNWGVDIITTIADKVVRDRRDNSNILIIKKKIHS